MLREKIEAYLDGGLDAADARELESRAASDAVAARLLAGVRSERALRAAAYESYAPAPNEAAALAARVMAEAYAPVGRVGYWVRRSVAVAAAIALVAATFMAGRMTGNPQKDYADRVEVHTVYNVVYTEPSGDDLQVREFATSDERDSFVKELKQRGVASVSLADSLPIGRL